MNKIMVHGGTFHSDDVMCVAIMKLVNPNIQVERVFRVPENIEPDVLVADIGLGKYDHHQENCELREDGKKHAACGLVFRDFGKGLFPTEESAQAFVDRYIVPIEDADNGEAPNPLSSTIGEFNPSWDEPQDGAEFDDAVEFCIGVIKRSIHRAEANYKSEVLVNEAVANSSDGVVILDKYLPTPKFIGTGAKLIVCPSNRGGWQLLTVKVERDSFVDVVSLPEAWLESKPNGCTFVHQARFIASFDTKDNAVCAAKSVIA